MPLAFQKYVMHVNNIITEFTIVCIIYHLVRKSRLLFALQGDLGYLGFIIAEQYAPVYPFSALTLLVG